MFISGCDGRKTPSPAKHPGKCGAFLPNACLISPRMEVGLPQPSIPCQSICRLATAILGFPQARQKGGARLGWICWAELGSVQHQTTPDTDDLAMERVATGNSSKQCPSRCSSRLGLGALASECMVVLLFAAH
jgi:hypothetical protein